MRQGPGTPHGATEAARAYDRVYGCPAAARMDFAVLCEAEKQHPFRNGMPWQLLTKLDEIVEDRKACRDLLEDELVSPLGPFSVARRMDRGAIFYDVAEYK